MVRIVLAIIVVGICWYGLARYRNAKPEQRAKLRLKYIVIGIALFLVLMAATGRTSWIGAAFGGLLVLAQRLLPMLIKFLPVMGMLGKKSFIPTGIPTVKTRFLRIEVDYLTGEVNGKVISGQYEGQLIKQLEQDQVKELLTHYREADTESFNLLNSYLNYYQQKQGQAGGYESSSPSSSSSIVSTEEAWQILGVNGKSSREEIVSAHKKLMQKFHPDRGGSDYLAAKINQAKEVLIGKSKR